MWTDRDRQLRQLRSCFQPPQPPSSLSFSLPPTISLYFYFPLTQKHTITATHTHMKATLSRAFGELHIATVRSPVLREAWQIKHESRFNKRHNKASFAARGHTRIRWYRNRKQLPVEKKNAARDWCQDCGKLLCGCDIYPASGFPRCFQCPVAVQCWNEAQIRQQRRVTQDPRMIIRAPPAMAVHRLSVKLLCINGARLRGLALRSAGCQSSHPDPKFAFDRLIIFPSLSRSSFFPRCNCEAVRGYRRFGGPIEISRLKSRQRNAAPYWLGEYRLGLPEPAPCLHPCRFCRCDSCGTAAHRCNRRGECAPADPRSSSRKQLS